MKKGEAAAESDAGGDDLHMFFFYRDQVDQDNYSM